MVKLPKSFPADCSGANCNAVARDVERSYDKIVHVDKGGQPRIPRPQQKGGLLIEVLPTVQVRAVGELRRYPARKHGKTIRFRRCMEYTYVDARTHKEETQTCTEKKDVTIPERTLRCYTIVKDILKKVEGAKVKRGAKAKLTLDVLALVGCSRAHAGRISPRYPVEQELMTSSIAATLIPRATFTDRAKDERERRRHLKRVRETVGTLGKTQKIAVQGAEIAGIGERQIMLQRPYQAIFDKFVKGECGKPDECLRVWAGFRKIFAPTRTAPELVEIPEAPAYQVARGFRPMPTTEQWRELMAHEAAEWKQRTGLAGGRAVIKRLRKKEREMPLPEETAVEERREAEEFERELK